MKITSKLLTKVKAYPNWFNIIKKYPDGVQLVELLKDPELQYEDLYFARHFFNFNSEELKIYNDRCNIVNSDHVLRSYDIENSAWIYNSNNIIKSTYVNNGETVTDSEEIVSSIDIMQSANIINSKNVRACARVADSEDIKTSRDVINSYHIGWGKAINSCSNLEESSFCYKCRDLKDCSFCGFVTNSKHCMFCNNISNAEYQIFNQQVTKEEFERINEMLWLQLSNENVTLIDIDDTKHIYSRFSYNYRFDRMFEQLSEDFYGWVGSLPQYNEQLFLLLFFTSLK